MYGGGDNQYQVAQKPRWCLVSFLQSSTASESTAAQLLHENSFHCYCTFYQITTNTNTHTIFNFQFLTFYCSTKKSTTKGLDQMHNCMSRVFTTKSKIESIKSRIGENTMWENRVLPWVRTIMFQPIMALQLLRIRKLDIAVVAFIKLLTRRW